MPVARAAALQPRDHRGGHLPGADHGRRGPRGRRRHRLGGASGGPAPEPGPRRGSASSFAINLGHPGVRKVGWLMGPRMLGLAAGQLNFLVSTVLASGLAAGSLTAYNYAFQLSQIPVGIIGVSIAVALFPTLSQDAALGRIGEIRRQVAGAVRVLVFVAAPPDGDDDRPARAARRRLLPVRRSSATRTRERTASALAFFAHRAGRPHRRARAGARLLRDAGHADAGGLGDRRGRHQRPAHGRCWSGRWASRASPWRCRSAP